MTPTAVISLIKDIVIVIAIGFVVYVLVTYGKDLVKISDMKELQKQLKDNAALVEKWQKDASNADATHAAALATINSTIAGQQRPVFVRQQSCPVPVSANSVQAGGQQNPSGGADQGRGIDYRPTINRFEQKYETALADCYAALDKWPVK